jgi:hypothetical protein
MPAGRCSGHDDGPGAAPDISERKDVYLVTIELPGVEAGT